MKTNTYILSAFALLAGATVAPVCVAQQYPARTVRMVVGFPPGGGTDVVARIISAKLTETWGQTFVVDNRGGAAGTIGADIVAKSPPDGHTLTWAM